MDKEKQDSNKEIKPKKIVIPKEEAEKNKKNFSKGEEETKINKSEPKKSKNVIIITIIILIVIFIGAYYSITLTKQSADYTYNNYEFFKSTDGMWNTYVDINGQTMQIQFQHHPTEVLNLSVNPLIKKKINIMKSSDNLILAVDNGTNNTAIVASAQISRLHGVKFVKVPIHGGLYDENFNLTTFMKNESRNKDVFITNCDLSSNSLVVMRFKENNETKMDFFNNNPNCIHATAKEPIDFIKLADRLDYELLGIIKT